MLLINIREIDTLNILSLTSSNDKLKALLSEGWKIEKFNVTPVETTTSKEDYRGTRTWTDSVIVTLLLSK